MERKTRSCPAGTSSGGKTAGWCDGGKKGELSLGQQGGLAGGGQVKKSCELLTVCGGENFAMVHKKKTGGTSLPGGGNGRDGGASTSQGGGGKV